jgi:hypothetical protein
MAFASHSGSCKHGGGNQRGRHKFGFSHSISPFGYEKPTALASPGKWRSDRPIKRTTPHVVSTPREVIAQVFKNQFKFINWFLIVNPEPDPHVSGGSRGWIALPGVSLGQPFQEDIEETQAGRCEGLRRQ